LELSVYILEYTNLDPDTILKIRLSNMNIPRSTEGNLQLQHNHDFSFHGVIYLVEEDTVWDLVGQKGLVNWGGETGSY